jgi:hypothetical protein
MAFEGGPYLQVGCLCENVIEDKFGVLSIIRVIDTVTRTAAGPNPPDEMPPFQYEIKLVLMFKSGKARGRSSVRIVPEKPTGASMEAISLTIHFEGEEKGQNFITNMALTLEHEGLYWFNVYLDDEKFSAIPLRVKYNRVVAGSMPQQQ